MNREDIEIKIKDIVDSHNIEMNIYRLSCKDNPFDFEENQILYETIKNCTADKIFEV